MPTLTDSKGTPSPSSAEDERRADSTRRATAALLREHPDATVFTQTTEGHIVPVPESLQLGGYPVLATDGRTGVDMCVAEDRMTVVNAWLRLKRDGVAEARARLRSDPGQWRIVRMLDLRAKHGVVLSVVWPAGDEPAPSEEAGAGAPSSTTPRFCSRKQDQDGNVIECDEAYLQMFGYEHEREVVGSPTFERVHPEDQARLIESWIAMIATGRVQMARVRVRRRDDSWLWVDTSYHNYLDEDGRGHVLAECIDVSAEMAAQEALEDREELLRRVLEEMPDGLLQLDSERGVVYHNARLLEILQVSLPAPEPSSREDAAPPAPRERQPLALAQLLQTLTLEAKATFEEVVARALRDGFSEDVEVESAPASGAQRHVLLKVRPLQRESGTVTGVIASVLDVTDSARARRELEQRATFDALTGAHNRSSILAALSAELECSPNTGVVYVDLDRFKSINDSLGHAAGDEVLVEVAARLKAAMRSSDELGRLGGDEFLILLRNVYAEDIAIDAAERIARSLRGTCELPCGTVELCASLGVACSGEAPLSAEQLIERADAAMYRCKEQGRGRPILAASG
jgi:diguanylate cyclase (GGDEF)-like protein/PAS domain S-box-containing protein